ncbi:hypothetical protein NL676_010627 [Syzygium grande]|nr:hypothetical protein NL676_010627 [Syzygium grande]
MPSTRGVASEQATPVLEDKIYVAVGKDMKESQSKLVWTVHQLGGNFKICIIHVLVPSRRIPMGGLGAGIPASSANEIVLREHRENEREARTAQEVAGVPTNAPFPMTPTPGPGKSILSKSQSSTLPRTAKLSNPFQDILRRAFSSKIDQRAVMPMASSSDSSPEHPNAASTLETQDTFQELKPVSTSRSDLLQLIQPVYYTCQSSISNSLLEEELEKVKDQLDKVMEEKLQLESQFAETDQSRKELELKIIASDEMLQTFRKSESCCRSTSRTHSKRPRR